MSFNCSIVKLFLKSFVARINIHCISERINLNSF